MATEVVHIIDPNNGSGTDYTSLSAWEAGEQGDLTGVRDEIAVAKCRCTGGTADTTAVTIDGWTTSATQYIKVWTDPAESYRNGGKWETGNHYRIYVGSAYSPHIPLTITEKHCKVIGLQLGCNMQDRASDWTQIALDSIVDSDGAVWEISHNIIYMDGDPDVSYSPNYKCCGIHFAPSTYAPSTTPIIRIFNNVIFNNMTGTGLRDGVAINIENRASNAYCYNNTIVRWDVGFIGDDGSSRLQYLKNNLIYDCTTATDGSHSNTRCDYNATDLSALGYTAGSNDRVSQTFAFVDSANGDFHLASSDAGAKDYGVSDPGSGLFSDDIDGQTRTGTWDIGADEYVAETVTISVTETFAIAESLD